MLRFAPLESGAAYLAALRDHVLAHGCPLAFYSDRHGIFRVNAKFVGLVAEFRPIARAQVRSARHTAGPAFQGFLSRCILEKPG